MNWQKAILILVVLTVVLVAWMGRYDITEAGEHNVYRLDRWSGELTYIAAASSYKVDSQIAMSPKEIKALINNRPPADKPTQEEQALFAKLRADNPRYDHYSEKHFLQVISGQTGKPFEELAAEVGYKEPGPSIFKQLRAGNPAYSFYSDKHFIHVIAKKIGVSPDQLEMQISYK